MIIMILIINMILRLSTVIIMVVDTVSVCKHLLTSSHTIITGEKKTIITGGQLGNRKKLPSEVTIDTNDTIQRVELVKNPSWQCRDFTLLTFFNNPPVNKYC